MVCSMCVPRVSPSTVIRVKDCTRAKAWPAMLVVRTQCSSMCGSRALSFMRHAHAHRAWSSRAFYGRCPCCVHVFSMFALCVCAWVCQVGIYAFTAWMCHPHVFFFPEGSLCTISVLHFGALRQLLLLLCAPIAPTLLAQSVCIACCTMCLLHGPCAFPIAIIAAQLFCLRLRMCIYIL